jgi:3'(2'), 5'-bisphosphate nucleotidase
MQDKEYARLAAELVPVARAAGGATMSHYRAGVTPEYKDNWSPVTAADREAEAIILAALGRILPGVPVVAEEEASEGRIPDVGQAFLLVDPLDGTREFIDNRGEFTVNIALIVDRRPTFGLVYAPATAELYLTLGASRCTMARLDPDDRSATLAGISPREIRTREPRPGGLTVVASRSHLDEATKALIARYRVAETRNAGSSLKFCLIARGEADLYPRLGPTMEWDTAAGHAVLVAAGGGVTTPEGAAFLYGKADQGFRNGGFLAWGRRPGSAASA